jgi:hypothetical protein
MNLTVQQLNDIIEAIDGYRSDYEGAHTKQDFLNWQPYVDLKQQLESILQQVECGRTITITISPE